MSGTAGMIRRLRANLLDELQKQYVVTGRAKGLAAGRLLVKYPLRMALNPFVADIGSLLPSIVSGSVIVSAVMSLQTTGPMLLSALQSQDMYLAGSFLMFLAILFVVAERYAAMVRRAIRRVLAGTPRVLRAATGNPGQDSLDRRSTAFWTAGGGQGIGLSRSAA